TYKAFGLPPLISVPSQRDPDPDFPTVKFPNPEEGGALEEAIRLAEERGITLVLANDPDADRLAVAERQPDVQRQGQGQGRGPGVGVGGGGGGWKVFSGNEIGALLGHWQWSEWRRLNPDADPSKAVSV
ncbi:unnamed protein product, partial [Discosporangium mesarthrocarpum]